MPSIPQIAAFHKFCQQLSFSVLEQIYPREVVTCLLSQDQAWEQRERKLNHLFLVYLLIVWSLSRSSLRAVCDRLLRPLRLRGELQEPTPTSAGFCYRRSHLGVRVLRHLFRLLCRPFADAQTPGSFAFGLRLMGIDGTQFSVAQSPKNQASFSKPSASAFLKRMPRCCWSRWAPTPLSTPSPPSARSARLTWPRDSCARSARGCWCSWIVASTVPP